MTRSATTRKRGRYLAAAAVLLACCGSGILSHAAPAAGKRPDGGSRPGRAVVFSRDIRPLLEARCWGCHGPGEQKSGLRLDTRAAALKGGRSGPALVPGRSAESELVRRITSGDPKTVMPPGLPLAREEIALLRQWIDAGAPWAPDDRAAAASPPAGHWAFQPVRRSPVPPVKSRDRIRNPIDAFIRARLERERLAPSPPADRRTLLRRVTFDLTGLPPTADEIDAFLADRSPDAYEKVVRRLLASPHYGERWAQHWLDVVRFAETNGFELDGDRPQAWRYRDWVVRALNADLPYDRFVTMQIAGDEIAPDDFEARVATGFLRAGPLQIVGGNQDPVVARQEWLTEAVSGVGNALLGLTINCARCHDHKFDPIPQADYYRLQAFFAATASHEFQKPGPGEKERLEARLRAHQERLKPIRDRIAAIEKPYRERLRAEKLRKLEPKYRDVLAVAEKDRTPEQRVLAQEAQAQLKIEWTEVVAALTPEDRERRTSLRRQMHALDLEAPEPLPTAPGVADLLSPAPPVHVLVRGEPHAPGERVQPGFPSAIAAEAGEAEAACGEGSVPRRTALARWIASPEHPLTARVMVNRLWQHYFGRGIVATANDFGRNGSPPTHPELLDFLASVLTAPAASEWGSGPRGEWVENPASAPAAMRWRGAGWSLKQLHFLIATSDSYRQASAFDPARARRDPENRLFWRMNPRRLDAEAIRDAVLRAAGSLNPERGGPSVRVPLEPEVYATIFTEGEPDNLWPVTPDPRQHARRSLYLLRKRNVRLPLLAVFDAPDMMTSCAARGRSVHALQALTLMNSEFMFQQSRAFAQRVLTEAGRDPGRAIELLYVRALGRPPTPREAAATERFLRDQTAAIRERISRGEPVTRLPGLPRNTDPASAAAWVDLCLAVFNLNEFVYVR